MLKDGQREKQTDWQHKHNEANSHFLQFCERSHKLVSILTVSPLIYFKPLQNKHPFGGAAYVVR
jgi:hypothetical protein